MTMAFVLDLGKAQATAINQKLESSDQTSILRVGRGALMMR